MTQDSQKMYIFWQKYQDDKVHRALDWRKTKFKSKNSNLKKHVYVKKCILIRPKFANWDT